MPIGSRMRTLSTQEAMAQGLRRPLRVKLRHGSKSAPLPLFPLKDGVIGRRACG